MTVEFRDPPASTAGRTSEKWRTIVNELRDNPGKAGYVGNWSPGVATQIRRGQYPAFLFDGPIENEDARRTFMKINFIVETRKTETGRADIYITYVGNHRS